MLHIVLFEPEIPPNTGNIIRLCANAGFPLHLIEPLGFELNEKKVRRAGLDYRDMANVRTYPNLEAFINQIQPNRLFAITTKGQHPHTAPNYQQGDALVMGPETRGLPQPFIESLPEQQRIRIPMQPDSRSLNLSNATAIVLYEAWRQLGFEGAELNH
jgi:tRNA (cytidine/uridine-2'-O-)-methyltransferase